MRKNLKLLHGGHCYSANTVRGQSVVPMKVSPEPYNFHPIIFCMFDEMDIFLLIYSCNLDLQPRWQENGSMLDKYPLSIILGSRSLEYTVVSLSSVSSSRASTDIWWL